MKIAASRRTGEGTRTPSRSCLAEWAKLKKLVPRNPADSEIRRRPPQHAGRARRAQAIDETELVASEPTTSSCRDGWVGGERQNRSALRLVQTGRVRACDAEAHAAACSWTAPSSLQPAGPSCVSARQGEPLRAVLDPPDGATFRRAHRRSRRSLGAREQARVMLRREAGRPATAVIAREAALTCPMVTSHRAPVVPAGHRHCSRRELGGAFLTFPVADCPNAAARGQDLGI